MAKKKNSSHREPDPQSTIKTHLIYLSSGSILAKFIVILLTIGLFHSFIDTFDLSFYLQNAALVLQGQIPFIDFQFGYPILVFIPIFIALIPALLLNNPAVFFLVFPILMIICDVIITACVYLISRKLWNERLAIYASVLYICSISTAYFVITKYDAFPTALMMVALTLLVYKYEAKGYLFSILGFFTKVFPIITIPFMVLFNAKETSLKEEIISALKVIIPVSVILLIPFLILKPIETLKLYIPIRSELGYYSNTLTFTLFTWLHNVFGFNITIDSISAVIYSLMGLGVIALLYILIKSPKNTKSLLKLITCALVLVIICAKVKSPQYIVWFTPLLCILAVDDLRKVVAVIAIQVIAYIEFPLAFGSLYTANVYVPAQYSAGWQLALLLFTLEYTIIIIGVLLITRPDKILWSKDAERFPGTNH